jgi:hypothetical protein
MKNQKFEKDRNYERNNNYHNRDNRFRRKPNRGTIVLKSTVFALSIIFATLLIAFIIFKTKHEKLGKFSTANCSEKKSVLIKQKISDVTATDEKIVVVTEIDTKTNKQELIILDSFCGKEISRSSFLVE